MIAAIAVAIGALAAAWCAVEDFHQLEVAVA